MPGSDGRVDPSGRWDIPAAFYRDDPPPLPPPGDPHRVEFYGEPELGGSPGWMFFGMPGRALLIVLLHAVAALVILMLLR